jgi:hypothetical protein
MDSYTPPVNATFMAFMQPVAEGYNGERRYYVRISLQSALNIPWDKGWSGTRYTMVRLNLNKIYHVPSRNRTIGPNEHFVSFLVRISCCHHVHEQEMST